MPSPKGESPAAKIEKRLLAHLQDLTGERERADEWVDLVDRVRQMVETKLRTAPSIGKAFDFVLTLLATDHRERVSACLGDEGIRLVTEDFQTVEEELAGQGIPVRLADERVTEPVTEEEERARARTEIVKPPKGFGPPQHIAIHDWKQRTTIATARVIDRQPKDEVICGVDIGNGLVWSHEQKLSGNNVSARVQVPSLVVFRISNTAGTKESESIEVRPPAPILDSHTPPFVPHGNDRVTLLFRLPPGTTSVKASKDGGREWYTDPIAANAKTINRLPQEIPDTWHEDGFSGPYYACGPKAGYAMQVIALVEIGGKTLESPPSDVVPVQEQPMLFEEIAPIAFAADPRAAVPELLVGKGDAASTSFRIPLPAAQKSPEKTPAKKPLKPHFESTEFRLKPGLPLMIQGSIPGYKKSQGLFYLAVGENKWRQLQVRDDGSFIFTPQKPAVYNFVLTEIIDGRTEESDAVTITVF